MEAPHYQEALDAPIMGYREFRSLKESQLTYLPFHAGAQLYLTGAGVHTRFQTETARELTPMLVEKACKFSQEPLSR